MIEVIQIVLCSIGICAVIGVTVTALCNVARTRNEEKYERQKKLKTITEQLDSISEGLSEIKSILEYK